jgi:hypothetical protein
MSKVRYSARLCKRTHLSQGLETPGFTKEKAASFISLGNRQEKAAEVVFTVPKFNHKTHSKTIVL